MERLLDLYTTSGPKKSGKDVKTFNLAIFAFTLNINLVLSECSVSLASPLAGKSQQSQLHCIKSNFFSVLFVSSELYTCNRTVT